MDSQVEPDADLIAALGKLEPVEVEPIEADPEESLEDAFPDDMHQDLHGLMWVGYLSTKFEYLGHSFRIKTLTVGEELAVAQVVKDYADTMGFEKAAAAALVAACIETVDGRALMGKLGPGATGSIEQKFDFITDSDEGWYWPTIEAVYREYVDLQLRQATVYDKLQSKSKANRNKS